MLTSRARCASKTGPDSEGCLTVAPEDIAFSVLSRFARASADCCSHWWHTVQYMPSMRFECRQC